MLMRAHILDFTLQFLLSSWEVCAMLGLETEGFTYFL